MYRTLDKCLDARLGKAGRRRGSNQTAIGPPLSMITGIVAGRFKGAGG